MAWRLKEDGGRKVVSRPSYGVLPTLLRLRRHYLTTISFPGVLAQRWPLSPCTLQSGLDIL